MFVQQSSMQSNISAKKQYFCVILNIYLHSELKLYRSPNWKLSSASLYCNKHAAAPDSILKENAACTCSKTARISVTLRS